MTQAHSGLKSLKPSSKPINTPLEVKVFRSSHSPIQSREETLAPTLEISTISVSRHKKSHRVEGHGVTRYFTILE